MYKVTYQNKKGAGIAKYFTDIDKLCAYLSRLHYQATIYKNETEIGRVWKDYTRWLWVIEE